MSMAFNEILVKQIKQHQHPCLYNVKVKDFKNRNIKDQSWIGIGNELKESAKFVSKRIFMPIHLYTLY